MEFSGPMKKVSTLLKNYPSDGNPPEKENIGVKAGL
jgi:hypothetical protein